MNGTEIREARRRTGITRADLARVFLVGESTVYRWETSRIVRADPLFAELLKAFVGASEGGKPWLVGISLRALLSISTNPTAALFGLLRYTHAGEHNDGESEAKPT